MGGVGGATSGRRTAGMASGQAQAQARRRHDEPAQRSRGNPQVLQEGQIFDDVRKGNKIL